ncbi:MAG: hypothetical protein ABIA63_13195 [bacterium]
MRDSTWKCGRSPYHKRSFMINMFCGIKLVILILCVIQISVAKDAYDYLANITSFYEQFHQKNLESYIVDLKLEGSLSEIINQEALDREMSPPEFREIYKYPGKFMLEIKNRDYSPLFKQVFMGMASPVKVFTQIIEKLESKRTAKWLRLFKKETQATVADTLIGINNYKKLQFFPTKEVFDLQGTSSGTRKYFEWSNAFDIIINENNLPYYIMFSTGKTELNSNDTVFKSVAMHFKYGQFDKHFLPINLSIITGKGAQLTLFVKYRKEKKYYVFDKKIFSLPRADNAAKRDTLIIDYMNYKINKSLPNHLFHEKEITLDNSEIEKIYREAESFLLNGKASMAKKQLKKLINTYPDSPQAKKAKTLLQGLP